MNYTLSYKLSVQNSIQKIARELISGAISECRSTQFTDDEIIHSVRKKCKRMRGLLRLVRPNLGEVYKKENQFFRDLGRNLSGARDSRVMIETLEKLEALSKDESVANLFTNIINKLENSNSSNGNIKLIKDFEREISRALQRLKTWRFEENHFDSINGGFEKTYRRGKRAMMVAFQDPTTDNFHEWRKRVKYHYYHLELLIPLWDNMIRQQSEEVHRLSELLGYDHDLCILRELFARNFDLIDKVQSRKVIIDLIDEVQKDLRIKISILGKKVYTEKTLNILKRLESYWKIWDNENRYTVFMMSNEELKLFTGLTNNFAQTIEDIKSGKRPRCYASRLKLNKLIYYKSFTTRIGAIKKEAELKRMTKANRMSLIKEFNSDIADLSTKLMST